MRLLLRSGPETQTLIMQESAGFRWRYCLGGTLIGPAIRLN